MYSMRQLYRLLHNKPNALVYLSELPYGWEEFEDPEVEYFYMKYVCASVETFQWRVLLQ